MNLPEVPPLPRVPAPLRPRQRLLDASVWIAAIGVLSFGGAFWGPVDLRDGLAVLALATAMASVLHAGARPALLRWANPARDVELPGQTRALLAGTAVSTVAVATGTVSDGAHESDELRMRVGSRVLLAPALAGVDPRRLAALVLTAPQADRGAVAPAVLSALVVVLAAREGAWLASAVATAAALAFVALGIRHHRRGRLPEEAILERAGMDAALFAFLVQGWTVAGRHARSDRRHADDLWRQWVEAARKSADNSDGLTAAAVDAERARLPTFAD